MPGYRRRRRRRRGNKQIYKNKRDLALLKKQIEYKTLDGGTTIATIDDDGDHWQVLNLVNANDTSADQDPDQNYRNGRDIWAKKIKIRGYINNINGTPEDGVMRIILARRKKGNDAIGTLIDTNGVLYNETTTTGTVNSFMNIDNAHNWDVLVDTTFGYDTSQHTQIPFKISKKLNHPVRYNAIVGVTTAANIVENALVLFCITNQPTEANAPSVIMEWRYSFIDL